MGLTNIGSSSVFQFSFCARAGLTEFYCPTIAIDDYSKALEIAPAWFDIYVYRSQPYKALGLTEKAEADLRRYTELTKKSP